MGNCKINSECILQKIKGSTRGNTNCIKQSGPWRRGYLYLTNKVSFPIPEERKAQATAETGDLNLSQDTKGSHPKARKALASEPGGCWMHMHVCSCVHVCACMCALARECMWMCARVCLYVYVCVVCTHVSACVVSCMCACVCL